MNNVAALSLCSLIVGIALPAQASNCTQFQRYAEITSNQLRVTDRYLDEGSNGAAKVELEGAVHSQKMAFRTGSGRECFDAIKRSHWAALGMHLRYLYDWWLADFGDHGSYSGHLADELARMKKDFTANRHSYLENDVRRMERDLADMKSLIAASSRLGL